MPFIRRTSIRARFRRPSTPQVWTAEFREREDSFQALRLFSNSNRWNEFAPAQEPRVIVDLGANRGFSTLYWKGRFPNAQIYGVEMDRDNFLLCETLFMENKLSARFRNVAIGAADEIVKYRVHDSHSRHRLDALGDGGYDYSPRLVEVQSLSFASFIAKERIKRIDILKVDIEGAERFLLETASDWRARVSALLLEIHHNIDQIWALRQLELAGFSVKSDGSQDRTEWWCLNSRLATTS